MMHSNWKLPPSHRSIAWSIALAFACLPAVRAGETAADSSQEKATLRFMAEVETAPARSSDRAADDIAPLPTLATIAAKHDIPWLDAHLPWAGMPAEPLFDPPSAPAAATESCESLPPAAEWADDSGEICRAEVWLVSTRCLPHDCERAHADSFEPGVWRHVCPGGWQRATLADLVDGPGAELPATVLVHGNQTTLKDSLREGWKVQRELAGEQGPRRFVVWTWPSDRKRGRILKDVALKASMANLEAEYFGLFLARLRRPASLAIVGFSLGAKVILGGLHYQAGGERAHRERSVAPPGEAPPTRVVLLAAAIDRDWITRKGRYANALDRIERLVLLVNPHDRVLRWYPYLPGGTGGEALGYAGLCGIRHRGEHFDKIVELNVTRMIHRHHAWEFYVGSRPVMSRVRREVDSASAAPQQ